MTIRIKARAEVETSFIKAYEYLAEKKLRQEQAKLASMSKAAAEVTMKRNPSMYGRLTAVVRKENGPGVGMDFEITRLRALDYTRYWALVHKTNLGEKILYLCATTPELMIEQLDMVAVPYGRRRSRVQSTPDDAKEAVSSHWDAGAYTIYVPVSGILAAKSDGIHVIPERRPNATNRHPHHGVSGANRDGTTPLEGHFLDAKVHTCWSQFATPVLSAIGEANVVEIFRFMRIFAGRYYSGSPLRDMGKGCMDFIRRNYEHNTIA